MTVAALRITEKAWAAQVVSLARTLGYLVYFTWSSVHSPRGFPDLCMVRPGLNGERGRLVFAELKSERGRVSPQQDAWLLALWSAGVEAYVWRPSDAQDVAAVLR